MNDGENQEIAARYIRENFTASDGWRLF